MSKRITVDPSAMGVGFYVAFSSDLGDIAFFRVKDHSEQSDEVSASFVTDGVWYAKYGCKGDPICIWGLSRWRGRVAYWTLGCPLAEWLDRQPKGVQFRLDRDRTNWPEIKDSPATGPQQEKTP